MTVRKKITTLFVAISFVGVLSAQQTQSHTGAESKLLSTTTEGGYTVSRYLVREQNTGDDDFSMRYKINLSRLISTMDNNAQELKDLRRFFDELQLDTLKKITSVDVMGYASPDGSAMTNERLAMSRAVDFRQYINRNFSMSKYSGTTKADALTWSDTAEAVSASSIPNKGAVLTLVKSSHTPYDIETKLKSMPESWNYMKNYILPTMRSVELCMKYDSWKIVEKRTPTNQCSSKGATNAVENTYLFIVMPEPQGVIVNTSYSPLDYEQDRYNEKFKINRRRSHIKEKQRLRDGRRRKRIYIRR